MNTSILFNTDSYKVSMNRQYPEGTEYVYSYVESRGGDFPKSVFFGLQAFLREYLNKPITQDDINLAEEMWSAHGLPFNKEGWQYILDVHKGKLPVSIYSLDEGTIVPERVPMLTIVNTDPKCFWLTTWLETALLRAIWYPTTVATQSNYMRNLIKEYLEKTGDPGGLDFKLHDFGARGVSSLESAGIGGAAHLINFAGTDTMSGIMFAKEYYDEPMAGFSIPATEHSTITSWGRENEVDAFRNHLQQFGGEYPIIACVSDSYDIFNAAENLWGDQLKQEVIDSGTTVVVRPDSGDPAPVVMKTLELLGKKFGTTTNDKGYRVLNNVRVIQGDGVDRHEIDTIMDVMVSHGWSVDNIAFGMGGGLLQKVNRDTLKFALKCSAVCVNGEWRDVYKDPITDRGKISKAGRVTAFRNRGQLVAGKENDYDPDQSVMVLRYRNGVGYNPTTFSEIRKRARGE